MDAEVQYGEILSTWKEIASYLKTSTRTCLRWEVNDGLPVHRQEGASKSRVYAYKHELDAWFKARLSNGTTTDSSQGNGGFQSKKIVLAFVPLVLLVAGGVFFLTTRDERKPPPPKAESTGVPQSGGPFDMIANDVVESEWASAGFLRVWRRKNASSWMNIWQIDPVRHTSLAVGNLDSDPDIEVIAPGHCREPHETDGHEATRIRFFLNAYKVGFRDWWKTTYFDPTQCVLEKENFEFTEIAIGNIDQRRGNEIVLITAHTLSVFRYDPSQEEIRLVCTRTSFVEDALPLFRSVTLVDIDNDGVKEILASANEGEEENTTPNKSWLFIFVMKDDWPEIRRMVPLEANTSVHSLRSGDIIPSGGSEIVFPIYRMGSQGWTASILGWNSSGGVVFEHPLENSRSSPKNPIFLDSGELIALNPGDEIVVARHDPNELIIYSWDGAGLRAGPKYAVDHSVRLNGVQIKGRTKGSSRQSGVLIYGGAEVEGQLGKYYLELINFNDGYFPEWRRLGGEKTDLPVTYASVVFDQ